MGKGGKSQVVCLYIMASRRVHPTIKPARTCSAALSALAALSWRISSPLAVISTPSFSASEPADPAAPEPAPALVVAAALACSG